MKKIVIALILVALSTTGLRAEKWEFVHPKDHNAQLEKALAEQIKEEARRATYRLKLGSFGEELEDGTLQVRNGTVAVANLPGKAVSIQFDWSHDGSFEAMEPGRATPVPYMANLTVLVGNVQLKPTWAFDPIGGPSIRITLMPNGTISAMVTDAEGKPIGEPKLATGPKTVAGEILHVKIEIGGGKIVVTTTKKKDTTIGSLVVETGIQEGQLGFRSREPVGPNIDKGKPYRAFIKNFKMTAQ